MDIRNNLNIKQSIRNTKYITTQVPVITKCRKPWHGIGGHETGFEIMIGLAYIPIHGLKH